MRSNIHARHHEIRVKLKQMRLTLLCFAIQVTVLNNIDAAVKYREITILIFYFSNAFYIFPIRSRSDRTTYTEKLCIAIYVFLNNDNSKKY